MLAITAAKRNTWNDEAWETICSDWSLLVNYAEIIKKS